MASDKEIRRKCKVEACVFTRCGQQEKARLSRFTTYLLFDSKVLSPYIVLGLFRFSDSPFASREEGRW